MRGHNRTQRRGSGLTLIEVLVALALWGLMTAMMSQGMDVITRSQQQQIGRSDTHARLQASLQQWQTDLDQLDDTSALSQPMDWNGQVLRWVRFSPMPYQGYRTVVAWGLRAGRWVRWQSQPMATASEVASAWQESVLALATPPLNEDASASGWVPAQGWQVFFFFDDSWSNALSSRGAPGTTSSSATTTSTSSTGSTPPNTGAGGTPTGVVRTSRNNTLPDAIRLEIDLAPGSDWQGRLRWVWVRPNWSVTRS